MNGLWQDFSLPVLLPVPLLLLLLPPLLQDLSCPGIVPLNIPKCLHLPLILQEQSFLRPQLMDFIRMRCSLLENKILYFPAALCCQALPPLLDMISHPILLVNTLVFGHKVDGKRTPLQFSRPALFAVTLRSRKPQAVHLPLPLQSSLFRITFCRLCVHDFR